MKIPKKVNVCGKTYKIVPCQKMLAVDAEETSALYGQTDVYNKVIRVYAGGQDADTLDTLIHEICHAIFAEHRVLRMALDGDMEEAFVQSWAVAFVDTMIRNKLVEVE